MESTYYQLRYKINGLSRINYYVGCCGHKAMFRYIQALCSAMIDFEPISIFVGYECDGSILFNYDSKSTFNMLCLAREKGFSFVESENSSEEDEKAAIRKIVDNLHVKYASKF